MRATSIIVFGGTIAKKRSIATGASERKNRFIESTQAD